MLAVKNNSISRGLFMKHGFFAPVLQQQVQVGVDAAAQAVLDWQHRSVRRPLAERLQEVGSRVGMPEPKGAA